MPENFWNFDKNFFGINWKKNLFKQNLTDIEFGLFDHPNNKIFKKAKIEKFSSF